MLSDISEYFSL